MKLLQFIDPQDGQHLGLVEGDRVIDLGSGGLHEAYYEGGGDEVGLVAAVERLRNRAGDARRLDLSQLLASRDASSLHLTKPVSGPSDNPHALKVWLAGVTHEVSAKLREIEAQQATGAAVNVYDQKYKEVSSGGRPELFSKGEPDTVRGHGQAVTRPADTVRLVPETELVSVYCA